MLASPVTRGSTKMARNADRTIVMHSELAKKQKVRTIAPRMRPKNVAICFCHCWSGAPPGSVLSRGPSVAPMAFGVTEIVRISIPSLGRKFESRTIVVQRIYSGKEEVRIDPTTSSAPAQNVNLDLSKIRFEMTPIRPKCSVAIGGAFVDNLPDSLPGRDRISESSLSSA